MKLGGALPPCPLVDDKLKFHVQCSSVAAEANKLLGIIRRSFVKNNTEMILCLHV